MAMAKKLLLLFIFSVIGQIQGNMPSSREGLISLLKEAWTNQNYAQIQMLIEEEQNLLSVKDLIFFRAVAKAHQELLKTSQEHVKVAIDQSAILTFLGTAVFWGALAAYGIVKKLSTVAATKQAFLQAAFNWQTVARLLEGPFDDVARQDNLHSMHRSTITLAYPWHLLLEGNFRPYLTRALLILAGSGILTILCELGNIVRVAGLIPLFDLEAVLDKKIAERGQA
jgi:hypothetical protein